jgi:hypothetical protein
MLYVGISAFVVVIVDVVIYVVDIFAFAVAEIVVVADIGVVLVVGNIKI